MEIYHWAAAGLPQREAGAEQVLAVILSDPNPKETDHEAAPQDESDFRR